nr:22K [Tawny frogmouth aviadenovirus A]
MAQRMLEQKARCLETGETSRPASSLPSEDEDIDGESLGSQDTDYLTPSSEDETLEETAPSSTQQPPKRAKRRPPARSSPAPAAAAPKAPRQPAAPKRRGNYRSWARHRVAIHQALRDAVFDRRQAAVILKRVHRLYVPAAVIGYYARKLSSLLSSPAEHSADPCAPRRQRPR